MALWWEWDRVIPILKAMVTNTFLVIKSTLYQALLLMHDVMHCCDRAAGPM